MSQFPAESIEVVLFRAAYTYVRRVYGPGRRPVRLTLRLDDGQPISLPVPIVLLAPEPTTPEPTTPEPTTPEPTTPEPTTPRHSEDFHCVNWYGTIYTFTHTQAACVRALWEAWEHGTPDLGVQTILERAGSDQQRLDHVFRLRGRTMHPAWGPMIVSPQRGIYRLAKPKEPQPIALSAATTSPSTST